MGKKRFTCTLLIVSMLVTLLAGIKMPETEVLAADKNTQDIKVVNRALKNVHKAFDASSGELFLAYRNTEDGKYIIDEYKNWRWQYCVSDLLLNVGDSTEVSFINAKGFDKAHNYEWEYISSEPSVVSVNHGGVITALSDGEAIVTLKYNAKPKLVGKSYSGETSINVKVGENAWKLNVGSMALTDLTRCTLVVGGDMNLSLDLPYDENYTVTCVSDDPSIITAYSGNGISPADVYANKVGSTNVKITVENKLSGFKYEKTLLFDVKKPENSKDWDNQYYQMYGDDYIKAFGTFASIQSSLEVEEILMVSSNYEFNNKMNLMSKSAVAEMINPINWIETLSNYIIRGGDYRENDIKEASITALIKETNEFPSNISYIESTSKTLKELETALKDAKKTKKLSDTIKKLDSINLNISKTGKESLSKFLASDLTDLLEMVVSDGISTSEYITMVAYLFSLQDDYLDNLQKLSSPGECLYDDVEYLRNTILRDPVAYFEKTYFSKKGVELVKQTIESITKDFMGLLGAIGGVIEMISDMNGTPNLDATSKAARMQSYKTSVYLSLCNLRNDIQKNYNEYSESELKKKIEDYEFAYSLLLSMVKPICDSVEDLYDNEDAEITYIHYGPDVYKYIGYPSRYDYNRYVASMMNEYYLLYNNYYTIADKSEVPSVSSQSTTTEMKLDPCNNFEIVSTETNKVQYRYYHYTDGKNYAVCPYSGSASTGTNVSSWYREETGWLNAPLKMISSSDQSIVHVYQGRACDNAGCIDESWTGGKYQDSNGVPWYREETRNNTWNTEVGDNKETNAENSKEQIMRKNLLAAITECKKEADIVGQNKGEKAKEWLKNNYNMSVSEYCVVYALYVLYCGGVELPDLTKVNSSGGTPMKYVPGIREYAGTTVHSTKNVTPQNGDILLMGDQHAAVYYEENGKNCLLQGNGSGGVVGTRTLIRDGQGYLCYGSGERLTDYIDVWELYNAKTIQIASVTPIPTSTLAPQITKIPTSTPTNTPIPTATSTPKAVVTTEPIYEEIIGWTTDVLTENAPGEKVETKIVTKYRGVNCYWFDNDGFVCRKSGITLAESSGMRFSGVYVEANSSSSDKWGPTVTGYFKTGVSGNSNGKYTKEVSGLYDAHLSKDGNKYLGLYWSEEEVQVTYYRKLKLVTSDNASQGAFGGGGGGSR